MNELLNNIIEQILLEAQLQFKDEDYKTIDEILDKNSKIKNYTSKFDEDKNEHAKTLTLLLMRNWINKTHRHSTFEEFKDVNDAYLIQLVFLLELSKSYNIRSIQLNDDKQIIRTIIKITNKTLERTNDNELRALLQDILHAYNNVIKEVNTADTTREDVLTYGRDYISFQSEHYIIYICVTVRSIRDLGIPGTWCVSSGTISSMIGYQQYYAGADGRIFVIIRNKRNKAEKYGLVYDINNNRILSAYDKEDHPVKDRSIFNEVVDVLKEHTDELHTLEQRKEYKSLTKEDQEYINTNIYAPNAYELFKQRFNNVYAVDLYVVRQDSINVTKIQDQRMLSLPYIKTKYYIKTKQFDKISLSTTDDIYTLLTVYDFSDNEFNKKLWSNETIVHTIIKVFNMKVSAVHNIDGLYYVDVDDNVDMHVYRLSYFPVLFNKVNGYFDCSDNKNLTSLKGAPRRVEGNFLCYKCNLTSLEGAPEYVGGDFNCIYNDNLTSLEGAPEYVGGNFNCSYNKKLISLKGAPRRVEGDFEGNYCNLTSLEGAPEYVGGNFNCSYNKNLISLKGAPRRVEGKFLCHDCNLTSLEGAPEYVGGDFSCGFNKNLTSLKGAPRHIKGYFDCDYNENLTSLEGAPRRVEGSFWCGYCNLTSLEGAPEYVGGTFNCNNNENLTSLEGAPEYVGGNFDCRDNKNLHPSWIEWLKQHSEIRGSIVHTNIGNENSPNPAPGFTHDTINNDVTDVVEQVVMRILKNKERNTT